jgi:hypothetical protein
MLNQVSITISSTLEEMLEYSHIASLVGVRRLATPPPDLPVERLVISLGEILNACKCQIQQWGKSWRREMVK